MTLTGIILGLSYSRLPDQIPIFFNHPMADDGLGQKQMLWELLFLFALIEIFLFWLGRVTSQHISELAKVAVRPELAKNLTSQLLGITAALCALACAAIVLTTIASAYGIIKNGKALLYPAFPIVLIGGPIVFLIWSLLRNPPYKKQAQK